MRVAALLTALLATTGGERHLPKQLATIPTDLRLEGDPAFAPTGDRVAYAATRGGESLIVLDEKEHEATTFADSPVFSADGRHVAWRQGKRVSERSERWWIVLDGKPQKAHDWVGSPSLSRDGKLAYWAGDGVVLGQGGEYKGGDYTAIVNGKPGPRFGDGARFDPPAFSDDGEKVAYVARRGSSWIAVAGSKESKPFALASDPAMSKDGKRYAFAAYDGKRFVLLDEKGKTRAEAEAIASVAYAPDGRLAWAERRDGKWTMVVDGQRQPGAFDAVGVPRFRPDGSRLAYRANLGGKSALPDPIFDATEPDQGVAGGRFGIVIDGTMGIEFDAVGDPVFSPKGAPVAYRARAGTKWMIVIAAYPGEEFDSVSDPVFSADGATVGFGARRGESLTWCTVDVPER